MYNVLSNFKQSRFSLLMFAGMVLLISVALLLNPALVYADNSTVSPPADYLRVKVGTANIANPSPVYNTIATFTTAQMTDMGTEEVMYSYYDLYPTPTMTCATGIYLEDLLYGLGIETDEVESIAFYTTDSKNIPYRIFSRATLFEESRYFYPLIDDSWNMQTQKPEAPGPWFVGVDDDDVEIWTNDRTAGKVQVYPMLAVSDDWRRVCFPEGYTEHTSIGGTPSWATQNTSVRYRLLMGQTPAEYLSVTSTASESAKWVYEIDVRLYSEIVYGDINKDGVVNISDLMMCMAIVAGSINPTPAQFQAADMNKDGEINIFDVMSISNIVANS